MARRTPQEKKQLSYTKDRRNTYGENSAASRRGVHRRRRRVNRANRRHGEQALRQVLGRLDERTTEHAEQVLWSRRPATFRKYPDTPLGEVVQDRLRRRVALGIDAEPKARQRIERVRRNSSR